MKEKYYYIILFTAAIAIISSSLHAESIFLRDGSIVEGTITTENFETITVKQYNGKSRAVPRKEIIRTLFNDHYKTMFYFQLDGDEMVEGYIVEEDALSYRLRPDLYSPREKVILKTKINSYSKKRPVPKKPLIAVSARPAGVVPLFGFRDIALCGTGGIAGIDWLAIGGSAFRLGIHGGCWYLFPARQEFRRIVIAPITIHGGYEFTINKWLTLCPFLDAGGAYNSMVSRPSIIRKSARDSFEPLVMAGLDTMFFVSKAVAITIGAGYGIIIEKSNILHLVSFQVGVEGKF
ncbi:MAG: hypothetical protein KA369_14020 [Spirochaetes bacterium]|nr:hypothetical protein [Spirochaetota bacterium]